jgi:hypothetical protein
MNKKAPIFSLKIKGPGTVDYAIKCEHPLVEGYSPFCRVWRPVTNIIDVDITVKINSESLYLEITRSFRVARSLQNAGQWYVTRSMVGPDEVYQVLTDAPFEIIAEMMEEQYGGQCHMPNFGEWRQGQGE